LKILALFSNVYSFSVVLARRTVEATGEGEEVGRGKG
jgi:hypothetical protein